MDYVWLCNIEPGSNTWMFVALGSAIVAITGAMSFIFKLYVSRVNKTIESYDVRLTDKNGEVASKDAEILSSKKTALDVMQKNQDAGILSIADHREDIKVLTEQYTAELREMHKKMQDELPKVTSIVDRNTMVFDKVMVALDRNTVALDHNAKILDSVTERLITIIGDGH